MAACDSLSVSLHWQPFVSSVWRYPVSRTDATGHFSIDHISPGRYDLEVSRRRYLTARYGQGQPDRPGAVSTRAAGQKISDLLFRMRRTAVIAGRIQDEDGEPIRDD